MRWLSAILPLVLVSIASWSVISGSEPQAPVPDSRTTVRLHHLHFRVGDPAAAMQEVAARVGGTRVLLQGLGVGVRTGTHFVLFDRDRGEPGNSRDGAGIDSAYRAAVAWLASHGLVLQAGDLAQVPVGLLGD